jgi:hypothetical protein
MQEIKEGVFFKNWIRLGVSAGLIDQGKINELMRLCGSQWFLSIHGEGVVEAARWPKESVVDFQ